MKKKLESKTKIISINKEKIKILIKKNNALTKDTEVKIEKELINWVKISIADNSIGWVLKNNITYLEQILYSIDIANSIEELAEIGSEIEPDKIQKKSHKTTEPLGLEIDGYKVYVGRNNKQNDYIVSKLSKDEDFWFHTKDCAGSHVLLRCPNPSDEILLKCAELAKEYSKASKSSKVGVIYTKRKFIKKPPKANLGYVIYKNEQEIVI